MAWHCKVYGGYAQSSTEAEENAVEAWSIMSSLGWSLLAFSGMWGNVGFESVYNPWRWEGDGVLPSNSPYIDVDYTHHAYGLVQWDGPYKYIRGGVGYAGYGPNFSDQPGLLTDGIAQLHFLDATAVSSGQYFPNGNFPATAISYDNYKLITYPAYSYSFAAEAWFHNYERGTWDYGRVTACQHWYEFLSGIPPTPPPGNIPIWLLFKLKERNEGNYD